MLITNTIFWIIIFNIYLLQHFPFPFESSFFSSNFCPPELSITPPLFIMNFFNKSSKNELKLKGFLAEVNLKSTPFSSAYFSAFSSLTCSFTNKSCLFPQIPKMGVSPKTSWIVLNQKFNSSKERLFVISYTNMTIFESFMNIFVNERNFSCPMVSHKFN